MPSVSDPARICETCGSPIETTSAGDFGCAVCLFDAVLDRDAKAIEIAFPSAPAQLGPYVIEHHVDGSVWELGRGAMGITYRAIDKVLDRSVALKVINTNLASRSAEARNRFMREARAAAALRHPNVATVYQFGVHEETGQFFYAMELIEGETLDERVRKRGPLDVLTTIDIALQVTAALGAAEERGLVHRDLKPGNLMLVHMGNREKSPNRDIPAVKVIDFGVAKAIAEKTDANALTHGGFIGTPAFASPEQFTNSPVDVRSDIYSLGATLWFLLTGHTPFSGQTHEEIRESSHSKSLPIEQLKAALVPRRYIALLISMLAIEPEARPIGARELAGKLQRIRASIVDRRKTVQLCALAATLVILAAVAGVRVFHLSPTKATPSASPEKSIAVLPFEDLSNDAGDAYLAEGIRAQILTRLVKIADLKVVSRASTQGYASKPGDLPEIARQLGVASVLEGSVQKAADQVRVNVQLVNAQTNSDLWAETYDRKLTDVLSVESEIAKGIAESLQAKLSAHEEQALAAQPTGNSQAYEAYLRGVAFQGRVYGSNHSVLKAAGYFETAVQLDPNFTAAWARLCRARSLLYFYGVDNVRREAAKDALEHAQELQPDSPDTLLAQGYYQYWAQRDYGLANATFLVVNQLLPRSGELAWALSAVNRRMGKWNESLAWLERALALDPRNGELITAAAWSDAMLRRFPKALELYDRAQDIVANDHDLISTQADVYQAEGNLEQAAKLLSEITADTPFESAFVIKVTQLRLEGNHSEAVRFLQARLAQFRFTSEINRGITQVLLAFAQRLAGDGAGAKLTAEQARSTLELLCRNQPDNSNFAGWLALAYAVLGEKDPAIKEAERAVMLLPSNKDAVDGPSFEENLALTQAMVGENSRSIATLRRLLQTPFESQFYGPVPLTPAFLRLDPLWDPLRADPAFQQLCEEK